MRGRASAIGAAMFTVALTVGLATTAWAQSGSTASTAGTPATLPSGVPTHIFPTHINPTLVHPTGVPTKIFPTHINPSLLHPSGIPTKILPPPPTTTSSGTPTTAPPTPSSSPSMSPSPSPSPTHPAPTATTVAPNPTATRVVVPPPAAHTIVQLGTVNGNRVLVDGNNLTLYAFSGDKPDQSMCDGACASTWPALVGPATAGNGVDQHNLGTLTRSDGTVQVTYFGKPLYHFAGDQKPGDANGVGIGNAWFTVDSQGNPIQ
jgi:predicted lipoprotein with Yx(FWY)xxD motif